MNIKLILFSGIITAFLGSILGLASVHLGQRDFNRPQYESQFYANLYKYYGIIGAGVGFAVGVGQECVRELKVQRDKEFKR
jgi:hypothetical protein